MSIFTRLVLLLTVLALLPFGSLTAKFGLHPRAVAVSWTQLDDIIQGKVAVGKIPEKTFATAQGRCKGPALPGSPCNPALVVWPATPTFVFNAPARRLHPAARPASIGQIPSLPHDPPRLA